MVRNPRTLMVCSLLALATGMALGSRLAPMLADAGATPAVERIESWSPWTRSDASADVRHGDSIAVDAQALAVDRPAEVAGLEGVRHPRMPRMSREQMARTAR
jgi:hypothetical protein